MIQLDFPGLTQSYEWDCGAKALQAVIAYFGIEIREELLIKYAKTNSKDGTSIADMTNTLKKFKLKFDARNMTINDLKGYIDQKMPILILLQAWSEKKIDYAKAFDHSHWVVAIGYDRNRIIFEDPHAFDRTFLENKELEERWHAEENGTKIFNYGIAVFGKNPNYRNNKIIHMD